MDKVQELTGAAARADELAAAMEALKTEKDETASKISELEIEILELKEARESSEDEHGKMLARIQELEAELADAVVASQKALEESKLRDEEHRGSLSEAQRQHDDALSAAKGEQENLSAKLKDLESELSAAVARHEQALSDTKALEDSHQQSLEDADKLHTEKLSELSAEIQRLTKELEVSSTSWFELENFNESPFRARNPNTTRMLMPSKRSMTRCCRRPSRKRRFVA